MSLKLLGVALALSVVVILALVSPSVPSPHFPEQAFVEDLHSSIRKTRETASVLQIQLLGLQEDLDWTIWFVDSLYDHMRQMRDEVSNLQQEIDEKLQGSLAANIANLYPLEEQADALTALIQ